MTKKEIREKVLQLTKYCESLLIDIKANRKSIDYLENKNEVFAFCGSFDFNKVEVSTSFKIGTMYIDEDRKIKGLCEPTIRYMFGDKVNKVKIDLIVDCAETEKIDWYDICYNGTDGSIIRFNLKNNTLYYMLNKEKGIVTQIPEPKAYAKSDEEDSNA